MRRSIIMHNPVPTDFSSNMAWPGLLCSNGQELDGKLEKLEAAIGSGKLTGANEASNDAHMTCELLETLA